VPIDPKTNKLLKGRLLEERSKLARVYLYSKKIGKGRPA
jgi:hypothetical protein